MLVVKNLSANAKDIRDVGLLPELGRSPRRGRGNPTLGFLLGESHGQRSLVGYSPWGCKQLDMTEGLSSRGVYQVHLKDNP